MNQRLSDLVQAVEWPEPAFAGMFLQDCDHMWGTEAGRAEVLKWIDVLGKPSQFVEGRLWTVTQLREHFAAWDKWVAEEEAKTTVSEVKTVRQTDRHLIDAGSREHSKRWHEAVEQRRIALAASKDLMTREIVTARTRHRELELEWDRYVAGVKAGRDIV